MEKAQIKGWVNRHNREQAKLAAGITPRSKGRPNNNVQPKNIEDEQAYEINRLRMENKLLRDFFLLADGIEKEGRFRVAAPKRPRILVHLASILRPG